MTGKGVRGRGDEGEHGERFLKLYQYSGMYQFSCWLSVCDIYKHYSKLLALVSY